MENEDSDTPDAQKMSPLARRWVHDYALTLPGYDELPCPTTNNGASLITQPGTPLPQKFYRFPTPSHEESRRDPYTPASTPRTMIDLDGQIFCLGVRLALSNLVLKTDCSRERCLRLLYDIMTEEELEELINAYELHGVRAVPHEMVPQEDGEVVQEDGEISQEDGQVSPEDWEVVQIDGASEMADTDVSMTDVPTITHTDFWVPVQLAGQKRKAPSLLEDPLDAEQPDEEISYEDKFEPFTFDGELGE